MPPPRTWLLLAEKAGDNAQVEALASGLPWPWERRYLRMRREWLEAKPRVRPSLDHLDLGASDPLEPPWPDLVVTMGRRAASVALWIQERSGGRTRIVMIGKPSGHLDRMALVVGSEEMLLPPLPNVFKIHLPLHRMERERVERAASAWRGRLAPRPRPLVAFLVGGPTRPFVYDAGVPRSLLALAREVQSQGGTPFLSTSRRTPRAVAETLEAEWPAGGCVYRWRPDGPAEENPYLGLLGLADGFVVTADSASMAVEVASLGRPLAILPLPGGWLGRLELARRRWLRRLFAPPSTGAGDALRCALARALFRARILWSSRDFRVLHEWLVAEGLAVWAGQPFREPGGGLPDERGAIAQRIAGLFPGAAPEAAERDAGAP